MAVSEGGVFPLDTSSILPVYPRVTVAAQGSIGVSHRATPGLIDFVKHAQLCGVLTLGANAMSA